MWQWSDDTPVCLKSLSDPNAGLFLNWPLGTNSIKILIKFSHADDLLTADELVTQGANSSAYTLDLLGCELVN